MTEAQHHAADNDLLPLIERTPDTLVCVTITTTMEQLHSLLMGLEGIDQRTGAQHEVGEWMESITRFIDSGWERS